MSLCKASGIISCFKRHSFRHLPALCASGRKSISMVKSSTFSETEERRTWWTLPLGQNRCSALRGFRGHWGPRASMVMGTLGSFLLFLSQNLLLKFLLLLKLLLLLLLLLVVVIISGRCNVLLFRLYRLLWKKELEERIMQKKVVLIEIRFKETF